MRIRLWRRMEQQKKRMMVMNHRRDLEEAMEAVGVVMVRTEGNGSDHDISK